MDMDDAMTMDDGGGAESGFCTGGGAKPASSSRGRSSSDRDVGMTMFMSGFQWSLGQRRTCLNLFFDTLKLDTCGRFGAACLGVFCLGVLTESFGAFRRCRSQCRNSVSLFKRAEEAVLYGTQLLLGYILMLIIMTYSIELFGCALAGVVAGHVLFRSRKEAKLGFLAETETCCAGLENESGYMSLSSPLDVGDGSVNTTELPVHGMTCAACVLAVRAALAAVKGVRAVQVDLKEGRAIVYGDARLGDMVHALDGCGFGSAPLRSISATL